MDLNKLGQDKDAPFKVDLVFDDEGVPVSGVMVVGANSDQYQTAERRFQKTNLRRAAHRGRGINVASDEGSEELQNALAAQNKALVCGCIVELIGFDMDGKPAELNQATFDMMFTARPTWIEKILAEIRAERGFTKP